MPDVFVAELIKIIEKNGTTQWITSFGGGTLAVRTRPGTEGQFDLWFVAPWSSGRPSPFVAEEP
jgi:hypothetical protein